MKELVCGVYDSNYVDRRWNVGLRHAELGLDQVYCHIAMARVRSGLMNALTRDWDGKPADLLSASLALNKLLDLDLALIDDAYQTERPRASRRSTAWLVWVRLPGVLPMNFAIP